jgi:hypothetical protein
MDTSGHALAAHRRIARNLRLRVLVGVVWVLVFAVLCILAWWRDWHWLAKFVSVAGVFSGLIGIAGDVCAVRDRDRIIRGLEGTPDEDKHG